MSEKVSVAGIPVEDVEVYLLVLALLGVARRIREEKLELADDQEGDGEGGDDA